MAGDVLEHRQHAAGQQARRPPRRQWRRPSPACRHRRGRRSRRRRRATGTSAIGRQSTSMPSARRSARDQPGAEPRRRKPCRDVAIVEPAVGRRRADRPASAAGRAAAPGRPPDRPAPARRVPTASRNSATSCVTWAGVSMLRLNRMKPHGSASRRNARSSAVSVEAGKAGDESARRHRRGLAVAPAGVKRASVQLRRTTHWPPAALRLLQNWTGLVAAAERPDHGAIVDALGCRDRRAG